MEPVYESFAGWKTPLAGCKSFESLPAATKIYIEAIERFVGARVSHIGIGPGREAVILR